jgi:hypothetical protein
MRKNKSIGMNKFNSPIDESSLRPVYGLIYISYEEKFFHYREKSIHHQKK